MQKRVEYSVLHRVCPDGQDCILASGVFLCVARNDISPMREKRYNYAEGKKAGSCTFFREVAMSNAGKQVSVHYTGTLDDGTKFDSSYDRNQPLEFVCMAGRMIPGFDRAVEAMEVGETKTVHIPAADAYGEYEERLVQRIPVNQIPDGDKLPVGETVYFQSPYGPLPIKVLSIENGIITLDQNHELAGKDLTFEITLLNVSEAPADWCGGSSCGDGCCGGCGDGCC